MNHFRKYYLFSLLGVLIASFYPLYMGVKVVDDMSRYGTVSAENYPKYIIPYTPISLAVIIAVLLLPILMKYAKKLALPISSAISLIVFFASELLLESKVIIQANETSLPVDGAIRLENWQMFMCYVPPESVQTRTWRPVDVLIGDYSPAFKLHFYLISVVLILALLNCFYGFAQMMLNQNRSRKKALVIQSVSAGVFLGLCILACFTAFFRDGEITVSALSAVLMSIYFIVLGVTSGTFAGSFLLQKKRALSVLLPSAAASVITLVMYIGELILLSGHLYRFGNGFLLEGLPGIVLAPIDLLVILASGCITGAICRAFNKPVMSESPG